MQRALRSAIAVYAGLLVGPLPALAGLPHWPGFAAAAAAGAAVAVLATRGLDDPERLLTLPRILFGFGLALAWLGLAVVEATSVQTFLFGPYFWGGTAALAWLVAVAVASSWRSRRRIDALTELVVFEARKPPTQRRQLKIVILALVVLSGIALVVSLGGLGDSTGTIYWVLPAQIPLWLGILSGDGREVAIADGGVRVEGQFHEWDQFDGYELTEEALTLTRSPWYHATLSFDRSDVEDLDAVTSELDRRLGTE